MPLRRVCCCGPGEQEISIDSSGRRSPQQHGVQQKRAVSRCQLSWEAEDRLVCPAIIQSKHIGPIETYRTTRYLLWRKKQPVCLIHTRTVVRECCKGDDQSTWERGKFDPPRHPKTPQSLVTKICVTTSVISTTTQNFIQIGLEVSVLRTRDFAPLGKK